jgi:Trypsin-like peptidase domain
MTIAELRRLGRSARGNWTGLVVVLAGVLSALATIANLTLWVSLSAAFAAVLGGLRVIHVQLLVPAQLEAAKLAVAQIGDERGPRGTAVHLGDRRWATVAHAVEDCDGQLKLSLAGQAFTGRVIYASEQDDLAVVEATADWSWHGKTGSADVGEGDVIRVIGWKISQYGAKERLSTTDLVVDGTAPDSTVVLAGLVPYGFSGAAAVRLSSGQVIGLVTSRLLGDHRTFDETYVVPLAKLPAHLTPRRPLDKPWSNKKTGQISFPGAR